ncbi:NEK protein kinase [Capronia epimyces CBS 606.96]|uniref:NEK protein kinase n=1 Tax=Capronia epimyces CBS 606.96 TaxID=1182542 RepID=W9YGQ3_9EURO|nr:NEK protein kinase [Capronia epimyces CBS 606.96]EXJ92077.1 NEK protein kinase [Capronia epimyces CBS 606.96]
MSPPGSSHTNPFTDSTIQEFLDTIDENSVPGVIFGVDSSQERPWVPHRAIDEYFDCLFERGRARVEKLVARATASSASKPIPKSVAQKCRRVFTILLIIGHSNHISSFVGNHNLWDSRLPFRPDDRKLFPKLNGGEDFFEQFYKEQWRFCVEPMSHNLHPVTMDDMRILPIIKMEQLDKHRGVSAVVRKITIHPDYDELDETPPDEQTNRQSLHEYVIKSYHHLEAEKYYDAEVDAFQKLHGSVDPIPNLVGFHGAFRQNKSFHIILDYATVGTLEDYLEAVNPPRRGHDIVTMWENLFKLNDALAQIHGLSQSSDSENPRIFQGWHQDIKPNNILVSGDIVNKPYEVRFMLADLGLSHFTAVVEDKTGSTGEDRGGSQAYSAPERNRVRGFVNNVPHLEKQKSDTWSLGCVYSEVNAWVVDGINGDFGVTKYRNTRQLKSGQLDDSMGACFHNSKGELLTTVPEWHGELVDRCAKQDHITPILWDDLLERMFYTSKDRLDAQQVRTWSNAVVQKARHKLSTTPNPLDRAQPYLQKRNNTAPASSPQHSVIEPPRTPPNLPSDMMAFPMTPPSGTQGKAPHFPDTDKSRDLTHSPDSLKPGASPTAGPTNRESFNSMSASYRNSGTNITTAPDFLQRMSSSSIQEDQSELYSGTDADSSRHFSEAPAYLGATIERIPVEEEPLELSGTSLLPPQTSTHVTLPSRPARPDLQEEQDIDLKGKGKAHVKAQPRSRKPSKSLSVDQLKTWAELTRNQSIFRSKEHKLSYEDELIHQLKSRDHIFVIDDGESMLPYWDGLLSLYADLIYMVKKKHLDPNGSELRFITSDQHKEAKNTTDLVQMVASMQCRAKGESNFAARLDKIFVEYQQKLTKKASTRPISIYVFTDGVWQGGRQEIMVGRSIQRMVKFLEQRNYPENMVGIQFIRFGNDAEGMERLRWLDEDLRIAMDLKRDICDTTSAKGNVWKMLLGSINDYWDDDPDP